MELTINEKIQKRLTSLYEQSVANDTKNQLDTLVEKWSKKLSKGETKSPTEKDVVLITYGDQVSDGKSAPLKCLGEFFKDKLTGIINSVHILPFYPDTSDDGFSVVDYRQVKEEWGSWEHVQEMGKDFNMMFDAVFNHISKSSDWVQGHLKGQPEFADFCIECDPKKDYSQVVRPRALPLLSKYDSHKGEVHLWTTFSEDQVDVNVKNPKVLLELIDILLFYVEQGAKLIRLDAIAFLWKEDSTSCIHLEQTHEVIKLMRDVLDLVAPQVILITETNVPHEENISYFGNNGDEAQMVYQFPLPPLTAHAILRQDSSYLSKWAKGLPQSTETMTFFNFAASHDGVGVRPATGILPQKEIDFLVNTAKNHGGDVSFKNNSDGTKSPYELNVNYMDLLNGLDTDDKTRVKRFMLSQSILLSMPGVPGIYFHSLFGSRNWNEGVKQTGMLRTINREKLNLETIQNELNDKNHLRNKVFGAYSELLKIRANDPCMNPQAEFEILDLQKECFAIVRKTQDETTVALHNLSEKEICINLTEHIADWDFAHDLISDDEVQIAKVKLEPLGMVWLKPKIA
jgi:sucrose phosphorylase